jgi:Predicted GTPase
MTIYALSTGSGISGLAVIRISGPECKLILKKNG